MLKHLLCLAAIGAIAPVATAVPGNFITGQWETTLTVTLGKLSDTQTLSECMAPEEANQSMEGLAEEFAGGMGCTSEITGTTADTVAFDLSCSPESVFTEGRATMTRVSSTGFTLEGELGADINGQLMPATIKANSGRVGTCES
ncbi:MAG: hypothetical protein CMK06_01060 [Ponticaulis sp.]|nr:hypothetical protein [Ponticaulis sp.]|tara:strand:- start:3334 stop:3765 length:432 start_codon:yes stop_codon:yes gene_type:complete